MCDTLRSAREKNYAGWSKFDALNSPFFRTVSGKSAWLRFTFIQFIKISPINLRPLFRVKISPNPKGIVLFARSYLSLYEVTKNKNDLKEAENLLKWLIDHRSPHQEYFCWGYNYTWQDVPPFVQYEGEPISIVTIFASEAFLHAYEVTKKKEYLEIARSAASFLTRMLAVVIETKEERAVSYTVNKENSVIVNIQSLSAALFVKIWVYTKEPELLEIARKQINFVLKQKTPYDAWFYSYPANASHIKHDNYHTGGVLDSLLEYGKLAKDERVLETYWRGLEYYKTNLFEADGAPRWMNDKKFPHDVHGAAQGIITFSKAAAYKPGYAREAHLIFDWTMENLYRPRKSDFIYRKARFFRYDFSLMHWCNGWMCRALGELIRIK